MGGFIPALMAIANRHAEKSLSRGERYPIK